MPSELQDLRALLVQALQRIDALIDQPADPRLPALAAWLPTLSPHQMTATQLYILIQTELRWQGWPAPNQRQAAELLKQLGYTRVKKAAGMTWIKAG